MQFETPEQRSKKLQSAQRALHSTVEAHAQCLRDLQRAQRKHHAVHGPGMPNDPDEKRERQQAIAKARADLDKLMAKRDELRSKIEQAKRDEKEANSTASAELVDSATKDYNAAFKRFIVARLESIADEAAGLAEVMAIREGLKVALGVRRDHKLSRLPFAFNMMKRAEEFDRLRDETRSLIDAGTLTVKDVPPKLAKVWNIT